MLKAALAKFAFTRALGIWLRGLGSATLVTAAGSPVAGSGERRISGQRSRFELAERCARMARSLKRAVGVLFAIFASAAAGLVVPTAAAETPGRITFILPASCEMAYTGRTRIRSLSYYLNWRGPSVAVPYVSNGETISWEASLAPGVYFYELYGWGAQVPDDQSQGFCSSRTQQIVVLPGDSIQVRIDMRPESALDDIVREPIVFGVASQDVRLQLISFKTPQPCGSTVSTQGSSTIPVQRDSVGYWSQGSAPEMALELQQGSQARYVRIEYQYWEGHVHVHYVKPLRFDVTPALMHSVLSGRPDTLLCL